MAKHRHVSGIRSPSVMVAVSTGAGYGRDIVRGVIEYSRRNGPWEFLGQVQPVVDTGVLRRAPQVEGIILEQRSSGLVELARTRQVPVVAVTSPPQGAVTLPMVIPDNRAVGKLAFEHLRSLGHRQFVVYGPRNPVFAADRFEAFMSMADNANLSCVDLRWPTNVRPFDEEQELAWLIERLPDLACPVGIFALSSDHAREVVFACHRLGIMVPEQVAVLGVNDDDVVCELCATPISAIDHGTERIGYEAAALLDRLMQGQEPPDQPIIVPPKTVTIRESTDMLASDDPEVVNALRFIRKHIRQGTTVRDVLEQVSVCRRTLESRFRRVTGRTVYQEITRARIDLACKLLADTDLPIPAISDRCGFNYRTKFSALFKRETGLTPRDYRKAHRVW